MQPLLEALLVSLLELSTTKRQPIGAALLLAGDAERELNLHHRTALVADLKDPARGFFRVGPAGCRVSLRINPHV